MALLLSFLAIYLSTGTFDFLELARLGFPMRRHQPFPRPVLDAAEKKKLQATFDIGGATRAFIRIGRLSLSERTHYFNAFSRER